MPDYTEDIRNLYQTYLGRDPGEGAAGWIGADPESVKKGILGSPEYAARIPNVVSGYYKDILGRDPDESGYKSWTKHLQSGMTPAQVEAAFKASPEGVSRMEQTISDQQDTIGGYEDGTNYEIPEDAYPTSYSGILKGLRKTISDSLGPEFQKVITGLSDRPGQYADAAKSMYSDITGTALDRQIPKIINNLANRGVLSSSTASDTLSDVASKIATEGGSKGYESAMQSAVMGLQLPQLLSQMGGITQASQYQDPSARERLLVSMLQGLM